MDFDEFSLLYLPTSIVLRFYEGISKNWKINIIQCFVDQHRLAIDCLVFSMIETYKELALPHPIVWSIDKPRPHLLFLRPKPKWKASNEIWFMSTPIGCNQLHLIINKLTSNFHDLCEKVLSNKIGQGVGITCMEEALALQEYGMKVIGHRDPISYGK